MGELSNYFVPFKSSNWYTGISLVGLTYWTFLSIHLARVLASDKCPAGVKCGPPKYFWPMFGIVAAYPLIYFIRQTYVGFTERDLKDRPTNLSPFYGFCLTSDVNTKKHHLAEGAVAHLDYACLAEQRRFNREQANLLTNRAYMITYSLFALLLFLQSNVLKGPVGKIMRAITPFRTVILRHALLMALLIITAPSLAGNYYLSGIALYFYSECLQIMGALVVLLLAHILYQVAYTTT